MKSSYNNMGFNSRSDKCAISRNKLGSRGPSTASPAQPLPTATLPALGSPKPRSLTAASWAQPTQVDWTLHCRQRRAPRHRPRQQPDSKRARAAAIKQRWPSSPQLPASTASVNCPSLPPPHRSPAPTPTARTHQGPGPPPRPAPPQFLRQNRL